MGKVYKTFKKTKGMRDPVIVTGTPRAGRSMIAGILEICGIFTGKTNTRFENMELKNNLLNPYFSYHNADPSGQKNFPKTHDLLLPQTWKEQVLTIMERQGLQDEDKWMLKSGQVPLMWPVWNYAFPRAKYVIVRRRTGDIVSSCMKTGYMDAYDNEEGWKQMCREYEQRFTEMVNSGLNCKVIWPHRMAYGDYEQIWELLEWLGLPWKTEILNYVDPKFLKIRKK